MLKIYLLLIITYTSMNTTNYFESWLKKIIDESGHPFVRDSESLIKYFFELYNQIPLEYGWRFTSVESFKKQVERLKDKPDEWNRLYWHDMANNIEAYGVMMIWRAGEILTHAIKSINARDLLAPAILSRSLIEIAAFSLKNSNVIVKTIEDIYSNISKLGKTTHFYGCEDLEVLTVSMIFGTRLEELSNHPSQTNILTYIQWLTKNKNAKELWTVYTFLCELAHPNVIGNARFWFTLENKREDGSERITMNRHAESVTTADIREKILWALGWSAGTIRNSFELLRESDLIIFNLWPK